MERSTLVPMGMGEQSLTPGEQRILALMEQGQQRLEQRLEQSHQRLEQQIKELTLKVDQEAAASKTRDRELAAELQGLREEGQNQQIWLVGKIERSQQEMLEAMHQEMNKFRTDVSKRFDQHDTRLQVVERTLERHDEHLRELGQAIEGLQQETRKLAAAVDHLTQASPVAAS